MFSSHHNSKEGFIFESPPNSSSSNHEFPYFDHQFHVGLSSSSSLNPMVNHHHHQTGSNFYLFDAFNNPYGGSSSSSTTNVDFYDTNYESKPFVENGRNLNLFLPNLTQITAASNQPQIPTNLPDEVSSCVIPDFHKKSANRAWKGRKKNNVVKGQWTIEEDRILSQLVEQYGVRKWSQTAQMLPGRIGKQCRERWHNHLRPDIKKDIWSEEEDKVLIQAHTEIGNKWAEIAKRLPGRTENSIKNHWNATKRRQYSKRKCRTKYPRGTLLQDYIKSLNLNGSSSSAAAAPSSAAVSAAAETPDLSLLQLQENNNHNHNRLVNYVPNYYDLDNFDDDEFDHEKMFEDAGCCSFDYSLLNDMHYHHHHHNHNHQNESFEDEEDETMVAMDFHVKKEMDLVEMISQAKM